MKITSLIKRLALAILFWPAQGLALTPQKQDESAACPGPAQAFQNPCKAYGFEFIAGTLAPNTTRWVLGEMHSHPDMTANCIAELLKLPGKTTVYLEGFDASGSSFNCQDYFTKIKIDRYIQCLGWDDMDTHYEQYDRNPEVAFNSHMPFIIESYQRVKLSDEQFDLMLKKLSVPNTLSELLKENTPKKQLAKKAFYIRNVITRVLDERKKGFTYSEIITAYRSNNLITVDNDLMERRDMSLMKTLRKHPKNERAILLTGAGHLIADCYGNNPKTRDYVKQELAKDKDETNYAILSYNKR